MLSLEDKSIRQIRHNSLKKKKENSPSASSSKALTSSIESSIETSLSRRRAPFEVAAAEDDEVAAPADADEDDADVCCDDHEMAPLWRLPPWRRRRSSGRMLPTIGVGTWVVPFMSAASFASKTMREGRKVPHSLGFCNSFYRINVVADSFLCQ